MKFLASLATAALIAVAGANAFSASLQNGDNLTISTQAGATSYTSYFSMAISAKVTAYVPLANNNGIIIGAIQPASGSHSGLPNGSESPDIDAPWSFFGNTGMHETVSAVTGDTTSGLVMSGWRVDWNTLQVNMGTGANGAFAWNGVYGPGSAYTLDYAAVVPAGDPSGFGGVPYALHLSGEVLPGVVIPEPMSMALVGSSILGLVALRRRMA
jgi:hypothetical protein